MTVHTTSSKALAVPAGGTWNDDARLVATVPHRTMTTREAYALAVPLEGRDGKQAQTLEEALRTQTTRNETGLVDAEPFIAELRGGRSDARLVSDPGSTVTAGGNHHALVTRHYGIRGGDPARHTTTAREELRTMTGNAGNMSLLTPYYGNSEAALPANGPIGTLTATDKYALVHRHNTGGAEMTTPTTQPLRTITTAGHQCLIQGPPRPARPRVTEGDIEAAMKLLPDCLFRMLMPRECAAAMAFPATYKWDVRDSRGRMPSDRDLVRMAGNAVVPPCSRDILWVAVETMGWAA